MPETRHSPEDPAHEPSRRSLLGWTAAIAAALGAMVGAPVFSLFAAPLLRKSDKTQAPLGPQWVPLGPASQFDEAGRTQSYEYQHQDGWYTATRSGRVMVRKEGSGYVAIDTVCTHVGCGVNWLPDQKKFVCPCHYGEFDANGKVLSGPPPAPLQRLETRVNGKTGQLEIKES